MLSNPRSLQYLVKQRYKTNTPSQLSWGDSGFVEPKTYAIRGTLIKKFEITKQRDYLFRIRTNHNKLQI